MRQGMRQETRGREEQQQAAAVRTHAPSTQSNCRPATALQLSRSHASPWTKLHWAGREPERERRGEFGRWL